MKNVSRVRSNARLVLAGIRFVMGVLALVVPHRLAERLDVDADKSPALLYFQRMFGIRTILIALDLVTGSDADRQRALHRGRVIHACDATAAALAGARGNLAPRPARMAVVISLVNLLLALIARPQADGRVRPPAGGRTPEGPAVRHRAILTRDRTAAESCGGVIPGIGLGIVLLAAALAFGRGTPSRPSRFAYGSIGSRSAEATPSPSAPTASGSASPC